jgi:hypothetical protein
MARTKEEWGLIFKYDGLKNEDLQKKIDFLKSLPKSGLSLEKDEQEHLDTLLALQSTRKKKPMVSATKKEAQIGSAIKNFFAPKQNPGTPVSPEQLGSMGYNMQAKATDFQPGQTVSITGASVNGSPVTSGTVKSIQGNEVMVEYKTPTGGITTGSFTPSTLRKAQSGKYKFPKVEQSKVDGSPTAKNDSEMKFFAESDDLSGGGRSITYWAEEIVRSIRYNKGGDAQAAYDNVIADAKSQGLTKEQEKAIGNLLVRWHIPVPVKGFEPDVDPFEPVKSDYTISFKQKQVAASLIAKRQGQEACDDFLIAVGYYKGHRKAIRYAIRKGQLDDKISTLLKNKFSREEVAIEIPTWDFPEGLKKEAIAALLPKKVVLASKRIALSNSFATQRKTIASRAIHSIVARSKEDSLSGPQKLRLTAIKASRRLASPYWIQQGEGEGDTSVENLSPTFKSQIDKDIFAWLSTRGRNPATPDEIKMMSKKYGVPVEEMRGMIEAVRTRPTPKGINVYARLEDGRVLEASIKENGEFSQKVYLDRNLRIAIKKAFSPEEGWVSYLGNRFGQKDSDRLKELEDALRDLKKKENKAHPEVLRHTIEDCEDEIKTLKGKMSKKGQNESLKDEASEEEGTTNEEEDISPKFAQMDHPKILIGEPAENAAERLENAGFEEGNGGALNKTRYTRGDQSVVITYKSPRNLESMDSETVRSFKWEDQGNLREEQLQDPLEPQRVDIEQLQGR